MTKSTKWHVRPAKAQISLGICPVWSESSLCTQWVAKDPSFLHADSEDSDQTGRMPRLIWVFAGRTLTLLVLSCGGSVLKALAISDSPKLLKPGLVWDSPSTLPDLTKHCSHWTLTPSHFDSVPLTSLLPSSSYPAQAWSCSLSYRMGVGLVPLPAAGC